MDAESVILVFRRVETLEKIRRALASRGYPIQGAFSSAGHALRFAGGRDVDIAIVGSDLQDMPVEALCRELSERIGCEVILLLSGSGEEASLADRLGSGVNCLPRPVTVDHLQGQLLREGEALLSYASDIGADLIVAGAYGHSRMRELAFGGVTRTLLNEMTVPVLFSH